MGPARLSIIHTRPAGGHSCSYPCHMARSVHVTPPSSCESRPCAAMSAACSCAIESRSLSRLTGLRPCAPRSALVALCIPYTTLSIPVLLRLRQHLSEQYLRVSRATLDVIMRPQCRHARGWRCLRARTGAARGDPAIVRSASAIRVSIVFCRRRSAGKLAALPHSADAVARGLKVRSVRAGAFHADVVGSAHNKSSGGTVAARTDSRRLSRGRRIFSAAARLWSLWTVGNQIRLQPPAPQSGHRDGHQAPQTSRSPYTYVDLRSKGTWPDFARLIQT